MGILNSKVILNRCPDPNSVRFNTFLNKTANLSKDCYLSEAICKLGTQIYLKNAEADRILTGLQALADLQPSQKKEASVAAKMLEIAGKPLAQGAAAALGVSAIGVPAALYVGKRLADDATAEMRNKAIQAGAALAGIDLLRRGATHALPHIIPQKQASVARIPRPETPPAPPKPPSLPQTSSTSTSTGLPALSRPKLPKTPTPPTTQRVGVRNPPKLPKIF